MARRRFNPDKNFELIVSRAALGGDRGAVVGRVRGGSRRRRTTLQDIADEIVQHAKEIVDSEVGLPSVSRGGGRNIGYDFRSEDRRGRTYRASFGSEVRQENGRLVIVVFNDHPHAQDVEYGNANGDVHEVGPSRANHGYFKLPITEIAYARIRRRLKSRRKPLSERDKILNRAITRGNYYLRRGRRIVKLEKFDKRSTEKSIIKREREASRLRRRTNERKFNEAIRNLARAREIRGQRPRPHAFVGRDKNTRRPVLFSRSFRTYDGYGILQRAARNISRHRF
jgi:hypothetical protein